MSNFQLSDLLSMNQASRDSALKQLAQSGSEGGKQLWLKNPNITLSMTEDPTLDHRPYFRGEVEKLLTARGWLWWHHKISQGTRPGFLDLECVRERILWIETKSEKGELTPPQAHTVEALKRAGGEVYIFRPSDWPEVVNLLW
jgi:hypothetical protein